MERMIHHFLKKRVTIFSIVLLLMFFLLLRRFFTLQVLGGGDYQETFRSQIEREEVYPGSRGIIYDRNGQELAYNELTYTITIEDSGAYESRRERNEALNRIIGQALQIMERNGDSCICQLPVSLGESGYEFTVAGTRLQRFLADVYGHAAIDELTYNTRLGYDERTADAEQVMAYLCSDSMYGIVMESGKMETLGIASVRYAMGSNQYQRYRKTELAEEVSQETIVAVLENQAELPGVDVSEKIVRRYTDSQYFAHILGYTGPVSEEELEAFSEQGLQYDREAVVGKTGIEQAMEQELRGNNGGESFYVDRVGRVTQVLAETEATAGNNIYLTIDADLQKAVYDLLEQKLAGILLANIVPEEEEGESLSIPIQEVYYALIDNRVINVERFHGDLAGTEEKNAGRLLEEERTRYLSVLPTAVLQPYQELEPEIQKGIDYIMEMLERNDYYHPDLADRSSEVYGQWQNGEISLEDYLESGISAGFITMGALASNESYTLIEDNMMELEQRIFDSLWSDTDFDLLLYRLLINQGILSGEQIGRILLEQGAVEEQGTDYEDLGNGTVSGYRFIREKIRNLEITPAQLALDPCTASSVVVDPGKVLACVTYPGYDNNRLANTVDGDYYNSLLNDASLPLYNNATQQRTAPGSTFKPVTVAAGMTEGIITSDTVIEDLGIFELITPSPRCWIYSSGATHGEINVAEAIRHSCNYYFYTLGYEMSLEDDVYREDKGTETLRKYAEMFGFNETTGIEIPESMPQMADGFPVTAAIGQSNHNYTTTQLARYTAALANKGTLFELSLVDRIQDGADGDIRQTEAKEGRMLEEITPAAWDSIAEGMESMAESNAVLSELPLTLAGKTGTAQQNRTRPNHALFIGYAPYSQPEIAVATRIAYGYSSSNALEVTADIFKYYFGVEKEEQLLTGQAVVPANRGNSFAD